MKKLLMLIIFYALSSAAMAQTAGRFLVSVGEIYIERAGQIQTVLGGESIQSGDTIRLGEQSNAQIRFTDGSIFALRSKSVFRVDNYNFSGQDDASASALFSLLKGGLRTVSGLVGKLDRAHYRMRTKNSTLGIRGTHYTLVLCEKDCVNEDGSLAADGDYGGVLEGRVALSNQGGEREFSEDEYFYVPNIVTSPQLFSGRPTFIRDRLEGRNRRDQRPAPNAQQQNQAKAVVADPRDAATKVTLAANTASNSNASSTTTGSAATKATVSTLSNLVSSNNSVIAVELRDDSGNIAVLGAGLGLSLSAAGGTLARSVTDGGTSAAIVADPKTGVVDKFKLLNGQIIGSRDTATTLDKGALTGDGNVVWARWSAGGTLSSNGTNVAPLTGVHYIFGNLTPPDVLARPVSTIGVGSSSYDYVGGTNPTNGSGVAGQFLSGSFNVDFLARTIGGGITYRVGNFNYSLPVAAGTSISARQDFIGFVIDARNSGSWTNGTQTGVLDSYSISGLFLGSHAQNLGVTFATLDARSGVTAGAEAFKCRSCKP